MDFISGLFIIMSVSTLAIISPGPDFLVVLRNALAYGRKEGVATAIGIGLAIYFHVAYCMVGLALLISQSILVFTIIKWVGAAYLIWLGFNAIKSKGWEMRAKDVGDTNTQRIGLWPCFRDGLLTNMLNPKATMFFLALFTQVIAVDTPIMWKFTYGSTVAIMATLWFIFVSLALTHRPVRQTLSKASIWIDRVTGVLLTGLGLKILLSRQ